MHSLFFSASETSNQYKPSFYNMSFHMEGHSTKWSLLYWNQNCKPQWSPLQLRCGLCLSLGICQWLPNLLILCSHWFLICVTWVWAMNFKTPHGLLLLLSFMSDSLQSHGLQDVGLPCPSLSPRVCSNSCPLSQWCHPTISSSVAPFSSCPQSFPASGSFPVSQLFVSGGQSIGASSSTLVLPMNIQGWFPLGLTG